MTFDPFGQRREDRPSIGRDPALALVAGRANGNDEVLNQERLVALEPRAGRYRGRDHLIFNGHPRRDLATATPLQKLLALAWVRALVHATRPDLRAALQTFQTRDLLALLAVLLFQRGDFDKQFNHQSFKLRTAQTGKMRRGRHIPVENRPPRAGASEKSNRAHTFAPLTTEPAKTGNSAGESAKTG